MMMAMTTPSMSSDAARRPAPDHRGPPASGAALAGAPLGDAHFETIRQLVYRVAGINLTHGKEGLVRSRLAPRLRALGLDDFDAYLDHLDRDVSGAELVQLVDVITTNKTSFFREPEHFDLLQRVVLPPLAERGGTARFWSAGCSSGEEPYTIAIVARELLGGSAADARILATDVSTRIMRRAREGVYHDRELAGVPPAIMRRHFVNHPAVPGSLCVVDETRATVRFARLNLMHDWPMRGPFDAIFCRNVMIYFDRPTQQRLVNRFAALLAPGGYLFVGQSESLTALTHDLQYVQPAVYRTPA